MALSTSSLTTFLSLNALQCDQLARLIMESIDHKQGATHNIENVAEAIKLCEQTLNILQKIQIQTTNELFKPSTKMKLLVKPNRLSNLPRDNLFSMCDYLDSFSKAHLRFTSMTTHIDMMGCPLDLTQVNITTARVRFRDLVPLVGSCAPMKIIKRQPRNLCGCDASRQLQLIDFGTAEVNQTLCGDLTESQLSLLGIRRSWSITGIIVTHNDNNGDCIEMCNILNKHNAYRSVKRLDVYLSDETGPENREILNTLSTCDIAGYVEDLCILSIRENSMSLSVNLNVFLYPFKKLRCVDIARLPIVVSLNDFIKSAPQIEELRFSVTNVTGDISCLAELKNIKKLVFESKLIDSKTIHGDITSLSSCTKLTDLSIHSKNVTGNIFSLITLTNLEKLGLYNTKVDGKIELLREILPKLRSLRLVNHIFELNNSPNLTGELVLKGNVELECLHVYGNYYLHLDLSSLTHLKKLKLLIMCDMPHVEGDISVISSLTNLKLLRVRNCFQVTGSINSLTTLPYLKKLELESLPNITGDASLFSHLDEFDCDDCDDIDGSN